MSRVLLVLLVLPALAGCTSPLTFAGASFDEPDFSISPLVGDADTVFRVDAGGLADDHEVTWDWGDGTAAEGATAEHAYGFTNGMMTVTMILEAADGGQAFARKTVLLGSGENTPPTVRADARPAWVAVGEEVALFAVGEDADGDALDFAWEAVRADDGAGERVLLPGRDAQATAAFDEPGRYTVTVRALDPKGDEATASATVDVTTSVPPASFEHTFEGELVAGTAGAGLSEAAWGLPAGDTAVDTARHAFALEWPGSTLVFLQWEDTAETEAMDLDFEVRDTRTGEEVMAGRARTNEPPIEANVTRLDAGEYELVVRHYAGGQVMYTVLVQGQYLVSPEMVRGA